MLPNTTDPGLAGLGMGDAEPRRVMAPAAHVQEGAVCNARPWCSFPHASLDTRLHDLASHKIDDVVAKLCAVLRASGFWVPLIGALNHFGGDHRIERLSRSLDHEYRIAVYAVVLSK